MMAQLQINLGHMACDNPWPFLPMALTSVVTFTLSPGVPISGSPLGGSCRAHVPLGDSGRLGIRKEQDTVSYNLAFPHLP